MSRLTRSLVAFLLLLLPALCPAQESDQPLLLAHYMPWYADRTVSGRWGWHWTMNHFDPEHRQSNGQRSIASHYYPLIGPYDSHDPQVIEYHLLTMKAAGIDGVIIDWYGLQDFRDYAILHRNSQSLIRQVQRLEMKFAICYEDQTVPALVKGGRLAQRDRVDHAAKELQWLQKHWFSVKSYVRLEDRPLLLSFGQTGLTDDEWTECLKRLDDQISYVSQHHRRSVATGAFDWPIPQVGLSQVDRFHKAAANWPTSIPVAFPRFVDIYAQAKVHESWGRIDDQNGGTFRKTLRRALSSKAPIIQLATWNDWGEGTSIEPSVEFGYRDLMVIQELSRTPDERLPEEQLRLPLALLKLRRAAGSRKAKSLDQLAELLSARQYAEATRLAIRIQSEP